MRWPDPGSDYANIVDDEAAAAALSAERLDGRGIAWRGKDAVEPPIGGKGDRKGLPACNRAFDRCERAAEQQCRGKDDGGTSAVDQGQARRPRP